MTDDTPQTDSYYLPGVVLRFLERNADTNAYCLVEATFTAGSGVGPNRHPGEDEGFFVLEGTFVFTVDGREDRAEAGRWVKIPDGATHSFRNVGDAPGRLLVLNAPGAMHDAFFAGAGVPLPPGTRTLPADPPEVDRERMFEVGRRAGMIFGEG